MTRYATIIGTGRYLPEIEVSNATLKERVSQVDPELANVVDSYEESSGIRCRWYAPRDWATSDIALRASARSRWI
jgi:3-oxoacyl-[acyl-carrier-protein] synthase-3